jgi:hypothetical protein
MSIQYVVAVKVKFSCLYFDFLTASPAVNLVIQFTVRAADICMPDTAVSVSLLMKITA